MLTFTLCASSLATANGNSADMRIVHILHEIPTPPNSGVRCDMWRRLKGFSALGHEVFAIAWMNANEQADDAAVAELRSHTAKTVILPIGADWQARLRRLRNTLTVPFYAAARLPEAKVEQDVFANVAAFDPDVIWMEGVHTAAFGLRLRRHCRGFLVYRSHNVEHLYLAEQARLSRAVKQRLALTVGTVGLKHFEGRVVRSADQVFDISETDASFWRSEGVANAQCLMPQMEANGPRATGQSEDKRYDLLYLGGLSSPNNIAGLNWFLDEVLPQMRSNMPAIRVAICGRSPVRSLINRCRENGVDMIIDPVDAMQTLESARILMNPILHGSGVNIKTIDMLATGLPVITTSKGARGLPPEIQDILLIADSPNDFAGRVIACFAPPQQARTAEDGVLADRRLLLESVFGVRALARALESLKHGQGE